MNLHSRSLGDELRATIEELAAFGDKRCGSEAGARAAAYLLARMQSMGLSSVRAEPFAFPRHEVTSATLALEVDGTPRLLPFAALEASGAGDVAGELVYAGWATAEQLAATPVAGKLALVDRNPLYHRSTQYANLAQAGARAMLTVSTSPGNLRQVGSVRRAWEPIGPIPALALGAADGQALRAALAAGAHIRGQISVGAEVTRGLGRNIVGVVPGLEPHVIVVGAHFDTWFAGSTDNGAGVAAMLALAARRARRPPGRFTLVFVAWDGEELALYGGYHFLRLHALAEPPLLVVDFETPSALQAEAYGLARTPQPPLVNALERVGLANLFALNVDMALVPELFGGVIPTDIQGLYRSGVAAVATAVEAPYYHTVDDTPDKVNLPRLEETVLGFDRLLDALMTATAAAQTATATQTATTPAELRMRDPALWRLELTSSRDDAGELHLDVRARDGGGRDCAGARVGATLFHDDFFESASIESGADGDGRARLTFGGDLARGQRRYLHVWAGERYPRVEAAVAVDF